MLCSRASFRLSVRQVASRLPFWVLPIHFYLRPIWAHVALNCVICLISSYWLKLGYYAPCIVSLTEPCGGELNAALVQACACGLIGGAAALHHIKAHKSLHSLLAALFSVR